MTPVRVEETLETELTSRETAKRFETVTGREGTPAASDARQAAMKDFR